MEVNKLEKHYWVWPIAIYLFLGGLGGGILFLAGLFDVLSPLLVNLPVEQLFGNGLYGHVSIEGLEVPGSGSVLAFGVLVGVACLGLGSFLLIFELGQPKVFLRVFLSGTAIIKYGACLLVVAMGFGFVYFLFFLPAEWNLFFYSWIWLRDLSCVLMMLFGLGVTVYTGVFLASMKSKAFWNTPALPVLFTISALSTGSALLAAVAGLWPMPADLSISFLGQAAALPSYAIKEGLVEHLHLIDSILVIAEIIVLLVYVLMLRAAGSVTAKAVALKWLQGGFAPLFWGGMIALSLLTPFLLYRLGGPGAEFIAPVLVLAGGLLLRFMVVFSDQRTPIPGEKRYYDRLPRGDEQFLHGWKAPY
ncbi:MAG: polysulfide reductase NrfD [Coriobacteriales bacterium]|nr:polysulfide reductase NrfD [Coriobacteriales bacterium]